jgi:GNAT superfamily N-acetyltransferase
MPHEWRRGTYLISTDNQRLDVELIHHFLSTSSYWARGRSLETVQRSLQHSLNFGLYAGEQQIGLARLVTDYATFAYLADVFVLEEFRGRGLATWLMEVMAAHPDLQGFDIWLLLTRDAHALYRKIDFTTPLHPDRLMERRFPAVYHQTEHTDFA